MFKKLSIVLPLFVLFAFSVCAVDFSNGLLNIGELYKKSISCTVQSYPSSDQVLVDDYIYQKYNQDGTGVRWDDSYIKILTENGRTTNKVLSFPYTLPYFTVEVKKLQVIKPNGKIVNVDISKNSKVMIDDSQMFENIYNPNHKVLKVTIPDLEVGDGIRCLTCSPAVKAFIPNAWTDLETFEGTSPMVHTRYEIISPKALPIAKTALLAKIPGTVKESKIEEDGYTKLVWEVNNVPRMFEEPNMPSPVSVVQRLLVSTINSWEDISKWKWELYLPHLNAVTSEMKTTVNGLIKDKSTDLEKINSIYYFVAQKIRYMGLTTETEAPGIEPHDVNITFQKRYGVCRDKNALLIAMLRIAGYKAYPVSVKVGPKIDKEVPLPFFNHAIACVELNDFQTIFLDATDENSKTPFPAYLCDRSYLISKPEGDTLKVTPIIPADKNLAVIETKGSLDSQGFLDVESTVKFDGINDTAYRNMFVKMSSEEKRSFFEKILRHVIPSAELFYYTLLPENLLDLSAPLVAKLHFSSRKTILNGKDISMINLPWLGNSIGLVNYIVGKTGLTERKYPLLTEIACGYSEKISLELDKEIKVEKLPEYKHIESDIVTYQKNLSLTGNILIGNAQFLINTVEFSPAQYLDLKSCLKLMETDSKKKPLCILENSASSLKESNFELRKEDARIIDKSIDIKLSSITDWKEIHKLKLKILSYSGKKDNAELKMYFNPKWETVQLLKASVTGVDGKIQNISASEVNIMDEEWNANALRYPEGKIFVANLPGVEIGSVLDVEYEITSKDKPFYSDIFYFREEYPIDRLKVTLNIPNNIPVKIIKKNADSVTEKITSNKDSICYEWNVTNQAALLKEVSTPPQWVFVPAVIISTGDWKSYFEMLNNKITSLSENQKTASETASTLTRGLKTAKGKIITIRDFISKRIKHAGPLFVSLPLNSLSNADTTLKDGYGNNADIAILYYAMLKSIGYSPDFVITSGFPDICEVIEPVFDAFQREILSQLLVRVRDEKSGYVYLNDTDEFSAYGSTANEDCVGFVLQGTSKIVIKPIKGLDTLKDIDVHILLSNGPSANVKVTKHFFGNVFGDKNRFFSLITEEDKKRYYKETIAEISQTAEAISELKTDFASYPGTESFSVKVANFSVPEGDYLYFSIFKNPGSLFSLGMRERFYPYFLSSKNKINIVNTIKLLDKSESVLIKPAPEKIVLPGCSGNIDMFQSSDSRVQKDSVNIDIEPAIVRPEDYSTLIDVQNYLSSDRNSTYLIKFKENNILNSN